MGDQWNAFVVGPREHAPARTAGPLCGLTFGVKDIVDVAGLPSRHGLAAEAPPAEATNSAVTALLDAGASCVGKTTTDQYAFSLSGLDTAGSAPVNPRDPTRLTGGSSSGSAAAVASGLVSFALATDTAGSIRVPASYCGIVGFRPSHGAVPLDHVGPLAPSFDTLGWFAADVHTAARVGAILLPADAPGMPKPRTVLLLSEALDAVDQATRAEVTRFAEHLAKALEIPCRTISAGVHLDDVGSVFRAAQLTEIAAHQRDLEGVLPAIRTRFADAATAVENPQQQARVRVALSGLKDPLDQGDLLALPAAAGAAPRVTAVGAEEYDSHRTTTIALNAVAGLLGAPAIVLPTYEPHTGIQLVGAPGADRALLTSATAAPDQPRQRHGDALRAAFYQYETALTEGDIDTLDSFFASSDPCIRFAPDGSAYSREQIRALRVSRAAPRELTRIEFAALDQETAVVAAEFIRTGSGVSGFQTQTWQHTSEGWRIRMAHVSLRT
ncbi:DUF3225 domain-containing protein [Agreia pratensis]|uniref:AtzH-like domain-containing protein n=1 Tax=Agreia pratensis TaxID=150121 RepID=UPI00188C33E3|nr:AtzH-like domain-containing protein [Agreia pratensis]MBF4633797.1 DUF3225 domain-containing protein [Agreia pratensis]